MTTIEMDRAPGDPNQAAPPQAGRGHGGGGGAVHPGPSSKKIIVAYGFWIFLLSDIVMFSAFFAAYAVLVGQTAGGPGGARLFDLRTTAMETGCLLTSSFACGMASIGAEARRIWLFQIAMAVTFALGAIFLGLELREFAGLIARGAGPQRSAFLSAFFALVGCHGLHITAGLMWLLTMMAQVWAKGFRADVRRRILCFSLFWHALDIVWVAIFTLVYLLGASH